MDGHMLVNDSKEYDKDRLWVPITILSPLVMHSDTMGGQVYI